MKGLSAVFLMFITLNAHALFTGCAQYETDQTTCINTPGCYYANFCSNCLRGKYCKGDNTNVQYECTAATHGLYTDSDRGSEGSYECFHPINCQNASCRYYERGGTGDRLVCQGTNDALSIYHLEGLSEFEVGEDPDALSCYSNERNCYEWTYETPTTVVIGSGQPDIGGTAHWNGSAWDISDCRFNPTGQGFQPHDLLYRDKHCYTKNLQLKSSATTVPSAESTIVYDTPYALSNQNQYDCYACESGYIVDTNQDIQHLDQNTGQCRFNDCSCNTSTTHVCRCSRVGQGYYTQNACNWESIYSGVITVQDIQNYCQYSACPAGKTTEGPAATDSGDCFYTSQTQFCDSKGCFSLPNIGDWNEI